MLKLIKISEVDDNELPAIDEPVMLFYGADFTPIYQRMETGRRVQTNSDGDWGWYGFLHNTMYHDNNPVTHFAYLTEIEKAI